MKIKLINFIALFLIMLVTGVFWGTWFTLTRSLSNFSAAEFIHIGKVIIDNVAVPMSIIMPLCILSMIISIWSYIDKKAPGFYLSIAALLLMILVLVITLSILVPIDNDIAEWTTLSIPSDWEDIRGRWEYFHSIRTYCSVASFACFALAVINNRNKTRTRI